MFGSLQKNWNQLNHFIMQIELNLPVRFRLNFELFDWYKPENAYPTYKDNVDKMKHQLMVSSVFESHAWGFNFLIDGSVIHGRIIF